MANSILSICVWNVNGLSVQKFADIYPIITKFALLETWHKQNNPHNFTLPQSFYRSQISLNARRGSGGIAVL